MIKHLNNGCGDGNNLTIKLGKEATKMLYGILLS